MTMQRGQACLRRFQGTVRATHAIREQRTRVRARTPACGQARHEVAVNFTTDRTYFQTTGHFPRATTASQLAREQAVTEWACALRIRTSQSESEEADCFYQRSIPNLSPLAVAIPAKRRGIPHAWTTRSPRRIIQAGGIIDCGSRLSRRRNRGLHHPACFYFVSFA